nr:Suppressor of fused protein (SUFU) [Streptococcus thermophilus]
MAPEETIQWLTNIVGPLEMREYAGFPIAVAQAMPMAATVGFNEVDTGLTLDADGVTAVRCELVCGGGSAEQRAMALAGTWNTLRDAAIPAQPGALLPQLIDAPELTVHHGLLREPQLFDQGTPTFTEPGQQTLMLELVLLTDDEYEIVSEQGPDVLERRLRRRRTDLGDWGRD